MRKNLAGFVAAAAFLLVGAGTALPARAEHRALPATPTTIAVYAQALRSVNPQMPDWQSKVFAKRVLANAERWQIDPNILVAIVTVESAWHTQALSHSGAIGLGQLMPGTAAGLGVNPHDPSQNLSGAAQYLSGLMHKFPNNYELVFAAYNAGPQAVTNYGGIPPFDETQRYVVKVLKALAHLQRTVHVPTDLALEAADAHAPDVDYWLNGTER
jgi:soluble lytic murein transglycosylase-like protein